jgi:hypothetical protein
MLSKTLLPHPERPTIGRAGLDGHVDVIETLRSLNALEADYFDHELKPALPFYAGQKAGIKLRQIARGWRNFREPRNKTAP